MLSQIKSMIPTSNRSPSTHGPCSLEHGTPGSRSCSLEHGTPGSYSTQGSTLQEEAGKGNRPSLDLHGQDLELYIIVVTT